SDRAARARHDSSERYSPVEKPPGLSAWRLKLSTCPSRQLPSGSLDLRAFLDVLRLHEVFRLVAPLEAHGGTLHHVLGDLDAAVELHARARGDEPAHDDVLLEAAQVVHLAADGGLGEDPGRLLEAGRRDERVRGERGLGDPQQERAAAGRALAQAADALVLVEELELVHHLVDEELAVP